MVSVGEVDGTWTGNICSALTGKSGKYFRGTLAQMTTGKLDEVLGVVIHLAGMSCE